MQPYVSKCNQGYFFVETTAKKARSLLQVTLPDVNSVIKKWFCRLHFVVFWTSNAKAKACFLWI